MSMLSRWSKDNESIPLKSRVLTIQHLDSSQGATSYSIFSNTWDFEKEYCQRTVDHIKMTVNWTFLFLPHLKPNPPRLLIPAKARSTKFSFIVI